MIGKGSFKNGWPFGWKTLQVYLSVLAGFLGVLVWVAPSFAASIAVGNMLMSGTTLSLDVVIQNDGRPVGSAGFSLTYPADRLQFMGADSTSDAMNTAMPSGASVRVGVMSMNPMATSLTVPMRFRVLSPGPYLFAFNPSDLLIDRVQGVNPKRAWIYGIQDVTAPDMWSTPDVERGNLFWVVPKVGQLTGLRLEYEGVDILASLLPYCQWYYDSLFGTAYLVLPSIQLPPGAYSLTAVMEYGSNVVRKTAIVAVNK